MSPPQSASPLHTTSTARPGRLAISAQDDDAATRAAYRPFLTPELVAGCDWISKLELDAVEDMVAADLAATGGNRIKVLVLFGSLRARYALWARVSRNVSLTVG